MWENRKGSRLGFVAEHYPRLGSTPSQVTFQAPWLYEARPETLLTVCMTAVFTPCLSGPIGWALQLPGLSGNLPGQVGLEATLSSGAVNLLSCLGRKSLHETV